MLNNLFKKYCDNCPNRRKPVWGVVKRCDFLICGESPGAVEEKIGQPFVGPSGKLLWDTLAKLGYTRRDFAIVNSACCLIDKKKLTTKQIKEVLAHCRPILSYFINNVIKPKYIFALGQFAASQLLGKWVTMKSVRGTSIYLKEWNAYVFFLWHPSYLLRNNSEGMLQIYLKDWEYAFKQIKTGHIEDKSTIKIPTPAPLYSTQISLGKHVAFDCEWDENRNLTMMSLTDGKMLYYVDADQLKMEITRNKLQKIFKSQRVFIVANRPSDELILQEHGIKVNPNRVIDIFPLMNVIDENIPLNLENIVESVTKIRHPKQLVKSKKISELTEEELIKYNAMDSYGTLIAFQNLVPKLKKDPKLYRYYKYIVFPVSKTLAIASMKGIEINKRRLERNKEFVKQEADKIEQELINEIPLAVRIKHRELRLTRRRLVADALFSRNGFGLKAREFTPTGEASTSEKALQPYKDHPWVKKYLYWVGLNKLLTTFLEGLEKNMHQDNKIYPTFQIATVTGRTVCYNPNIQQVPRDNSLPYCNKLKELYAAPKGFFLLARDYGQSEFRIMAWLSGQQDLVEALKRGEDPHRLTASRILKKKPEAVTKDERQLSKGINFGLIYGASANTLQRYLKENYGIDISLKEAEQFREKFFQTYPHFRKFHNRCSMIIQKKGYIRSPLGRIRRLFNPSRDKNPEDLNRLIRQGINFVIQSFSSDMALIAMYLFWKKFRKSKTIWPLFFIHDSIFVMAHKIRIAEAMFYLKECMEELAPAYIEKYFNIKVGYPVVTDGKIGRDWSRMEEINDNKFFIDGDKWEIILKEYGRKLKERRMKNGK